MQFSLMAITTLLLKRSQNPSYTQQQHCHVPLQIVFLLHFNDYIALKDVSFNVEVPTYEF